MSLRECDGFSSQRDALFPDPRIWDCVFFGLDFILSANPQVGTQLGDTGVWALIVGPAPAFGVQRLRLYYTVDGDYVDLRWLELS